MNKILKNIERIAKELNEIEGDIFGARTSYNEYLREYYLTKAILAEGNNSTLENDELDIKLSLINDFATEALDLIGQLEAKRDSLLGDLERAYK